ncbi:MAG: hypothetical protein U0794_07050 [Isosphaeraceae bacterium]
MALAALPSGIALATRSWVRFTAQAGVLGGITGQAHATRTAAPHVLETNSSA